MAKVDPAQLVFLDETSTPTTLTPVRRERPAGSGRTAESRADGARRFPGWRR